MSTKATRGSDVETWVKAERDRFARATDFWVTLDDLLDDYRLKADVGQDLVVCPEPEQDERRLWGQPGSEIMQWDAAAAYESQIDGQVDDQGKPGVGYELEEWSVRKPIDHLPLAESITEDIGERVASDAMTEDVWDAWEHVFSKPEVIAAAEALREVIAAQMVGASCGMADKLLATHVVTWDAAGEPLLDGEPMYLGRPTPIDDLNNAIEDLRTRTAPYGDGLAHRPAATYDERAFENRMIEAAGEAS